MPKYELVITNDTLKSTPLTLSVLELIGPQGIQGPEGPRGVIGVTDNGGDGSLEYDPITGIFTYTGPSAAEVRDHFSNGTGVTITDGQISIGQPVATNDDVIFNNVTSDLTGNADTADALTFIVRNSTGATLTKGTVVYVSGIQGNTPEVSAAQADSSATMPAFGLVQADIADSGNGVVTTFGSLLGLSVANFGETGVTFSLGDTVYVSATEAGKLTNVAPAGESSLIQNIGKIERGSPTTNMTIKVGGAGRTNATPNLDDGNIFIGNASNQSVTSDLNSEVRSRVSATGDLGYDQNTGVFSFTERTDAEVQGLISATDNGGDGSLSYDNTTGVISYTGPNASEVRAHFSGGTGVTITNGEVAIGQPVATTDDVTFDDLTLTGQLKGPATFTIDPAAHGDDTGTVVVAGNLQVDGTTTTVNSTTVEVADKNVVLGANATADTENHGAGITVSRPDSTDATISWDETNDEWDVTNGLSVAGDITVSGTVNGRDVAADGSKLNGIEAGATADQTGAEIKALYEAEANAFTDAQFTKLAGIETGATADQTGSEIKTALFAEADTNNLTDTLLTKLNGIEDNADVTDTANVEAAGALMDSEVPNLAQVKAFDSADYATAAQGALADTAVQPNDSPTFGTLNATTVDFGDWTVTESGGSLYFATGGNNKMKLDASGNLQVVGNVESNATIS